MTRFFSCSGELKVSWLQVRKRLIDSKNLSCYIVVTLSLHCYYTVIKLLLHCYYTVITLSLHCYYTGCVCLWLGTINILSRIYLLFVIILCLKLSANVLCIYGVFNWVCFAFGMKHNLCYLTYIFLYYYFCPHYIENVDVQSFVLVPIELLLLLCTFRCTV